MLEQIVAASVIQSLSPKQIDYILTWVGVLLEVLEGTTFSGKSFIQQIKFGLWVAMSKYKFHVIACKTGSKAEEMIQDENGFLKIFPSAIYRRYGSKEIRAPHIEFMGKIILLVGYGNSVEWEKVRGKNGIGMVLIDELNLCDPDFAKELIGRANNFAMASLNPDDPRKPCYEMYINRCRPYKKYEADVPREIMAELNKCAPQKGFFYWFMSFADNPAATPEIIEGRKAKFVPGSKQFKNMILGLRGRCAGLVFPMFKDSNIVSARDIKKKVENGEIVPLYYTCGVDTAYSSKSEDATVFTYQMITADRKVIILDEAYFNNKNLENPLAPSDTVPNLIAFLKKNQREWGFCNGGVWIDSADKATAMEVEKYQRSNWDCPYRFNDAAKQTKIIDRIKMMQSWIYTGYYLVCDHCKEHLFELSAYSWDEGKIETPEDRNDHTINSSQYGWLPYKWELGATKYEE